MALSQGLNSLASPRWQTTIYSSFLLVGPEELLNIPSVIPLARRAALISLSYCLPSMVLPLNSFLSAVRIAELRTERDERPGGN
jgi:hypothetical protein